NRRDDAAGGSAAAAVRRDPIRATEPGWTDADHGQPVLPAVDAGSVALDGRLGAGRIRAGRESIHARREPVHRDLAVRWGPGVRRAYRSGRSAADGAHRADVSVCAVPRAAGDLAVLTDGDGIVVSTGRHHLSGDPGEFRGGVLAAPPHLLNDGLRGWG